MAIKILFNLILIIISFAELFKCQIEILSPVIIRNKFENGRIKAECLNCAKLLEIINMPANFYFSPACPPFEQNVDLFKPSFAIIEDTRYNISATTDCLFNVYEHLSYLENRGVKLVMIEINDNREFLKNYLFDFYLWDNIKIPVVLVSKEEIDLFRSHLTEGKQKFEVMIDENMLFVDKLVIDAYVTEENDLKEIISTIKEFDWQLKEKIIQFKPHYISYNLPWKESLNKDQCVCDYKYCLLYGQNAAETFERNLISSCIYEYGNTINNPTFYISFMKLWFWEIKQNLTDIRLTDIMSLLKIDQTIIKNCYVNSFYPPLNDIRNCTTQTNKILEKELQDHNSYYSSIIVNGRPLRTNGSPTYLKDMICTSLGKREINACNNVSKSQESGSHTGIIIFVVIIVIVLNIVVFILCRRYSSRKLHESIDDREISNRVNYFINNYSQFKA